jgi:adenine-specific DNA-methyltransferase
MNKKDLLAKLKQLEGLTPDERAELINLLNTKKKYGLIWEDKPEDVEEQLRTQLPVLREVVEKRILATKSESDTATTKTSNNNLFSEEENQENKENQTNHSSDNGLLSEVEAPNHILIEGDNLHALTALTFTHEGKIDVIYIDPPYNTGNKDKEGKTDFKYNDDYVDKEDSYRHSKWLSFMEKRLKIAKKLLSNNGFLAISIDDNEFAQLKVLLDDLFEGNTKTIAIKMSEASGLKMSSVYKLGIIPKYKEYLLLAKPGGINGFWFDNIPKGVWDNEYNIFLDNLSKEDRFLISEISQKENIDDTDIQLLDKVAENISLKSLTDKHKELGLSSKKEKETFNFENSWSICQCATSSSVLRLAEEKKLSNKNPLFFVKSIRDGKLYFVRATYSNESSKPRVQLIFADENLSTHPGDFWSDIKTTGLEAEGGVSFKNGKKPLRLLMRILKSNLKKDSTILDFFAGSGSTLHAALELNSLDNGNRKVILVTNNENNICEDVTYKRAKNIILGYDNKSSVFNGYISNNLRYYRCDFVSSSKTEQNKRLLTRASTELLKIKENCFTDITEEHEFDSVACRIFSDNKGKYLIVVYHTRKPLEVIESLKQFIKTTKDKTEKIKLYAFSPEKETLMEDFWDVADQIEAVPLPDAIYNAYRATFRTIKLNNKPAQSTIESLTEQPTEE